MNKIQKLIKGLGLLFKNPRLINLIMDSEFHWKKYLKKHHNNLLQLPTADISQLIENSSELNHYTFLRTYSISNFSLLTLETGGFLPAMVVEL